MMSGRIDVPAPPVIPAVVAGETGLLDRLASHDLSRLTIGFYGLFWGGMLIVAGLCDSLASLTIRLLHVVLLSCGCLGLVVGARRLHQVNTLGDTWRRRTREGLIAAGLLAYLCPFFLMWRRLPVNLYLLGHALAFLAVFCYSLTLCCQTVAVIGRAAGKRSLVVQAILFGAISVVVLFPPFAVFAQVMILAAHDGRDPLGLLQFWLGRATPWLVLMPVVPFALTLSLLWAAKELVLERLLATRQDKLDL
jgi:hypothetical protein